MRIHHLHCGTMCPYAIRLAPGFSRAQVPGHMVCHCLLLETDDGLVLVDTGLGTDVIQDPERWLGLAFMILTRPSLHPAQSARAQIESLGFQASDVRHVVLTHLDLDHAGGVADFPHAQVHVLQREHAAAMAPSRYQDRRRYRSRMWAHPARWVLHQVEGDRWFGFERVLVLPGLREEIALIPLVGHTEGHCGVAVPTPTGWLLHAGDAYFHHQEIAPDRPDSPLGLALFQRFLDTDSTARRANQARLRDLARAQGDSVRIFCSHDPLELAPFVGSQP